MKIAIYAAGAAINGAGELESHIKRQLDDLQVKASNRFVAATAELGTASGATLRRVLDPKGRWPAELLSDTNGGDPNVLLDYVEWSQRIMPSERLIVVLSGHGLAWQDEIAHQLLTGQTRSALYGGSEYSDLLINSVNAFARRNLRRLSSRALLLDGTDRDYLSNAELGACFSRLSSQIGHSVDCVILDACLMSSWEILQELNGSVSTVVASIDELSAAGIAYSTNVVDFTHLKGEMTGPEVASSVVNGYSPIASFDSCIAINLEKATWNLGIENFRDLCISLNTWVGLSENNRIMFRAALRNASYSIVKSRSGALADVRELFAQISQIPSLPHELETKIPVVENCLRESILAKATGRDYNDALGLSIFSPASHFVYDVNRHDYTRLQFSMYTGWGNVLNTVFRGSS